MNVKVITGFFLLMVVVTSCSSIIYAIRGPKYEGKFDVSKKVENLEFNKYYYYCWDAGDSKWYYYMKFCDDGHLKGGLSKNQILSSVQLDSINSVGIERGNWYIFKNGYLRWETYSDSYNGYNLYKAKVYTDSIVAWQILDKRASITTYYKMK